MCKCGLKCAGGVVVWGKVFGPRLGLNPKYWRDIVEGREAGRKATQCLAEGMCQQFLCSLLQVIYELTEGERQLIDDFKLVKKVRLCPVNNRGQYWQPFLNQTNIVSSCLVQIQQNIVMIPSSKMSRLLFVFSFAHVCACGVQVYYEPMLTLHIMTESELWQIFGTLDSLLPLHEGMLELRRKPLEKSPPKNLRWQISAPPTHGL